MPKKREIEEALLLFRFPALCLCNLSGHCSDQFVLFRELSSEVIEHQVLCRNAKIVEHLLNSFRHRTGTTHIVFNIFRSFVILQVSFVNYVVNESGVYFTPAASAAGSGRSRAKWKVKFGKSFSICRKSSR